MNIQKLLMPLALLCFLFSSCDKVDSPDPIGTNGQKLLHFLNYGGTGVNFGKSLLAFSPSSTSKVVEYYVEYSTPVVSNAPITATISVDTAALNAYNAGKPANKQYLLLPSNTYKLLDTTTTVGAGQTVSLPLHIEFNPSLIDQSKNFMLPITITRTMGAPGDVIVASGTGTAYFHMIGNPLAGNYTVVGKRYNYTGSVAWAGPPAPFPAGAAISDVPATKFASPVDGQTVSIEFAGLSGLGYSYEITGDATFATIAVNYSTALLNASSSRKTYITNYIPPSPTQKASFHIYTHYNNAAAGGGNDRIIDELFTQQ